MSVYVKQFDAIVNANFAGLAKVTDANNTILVGGADTAACTIVVDTDGNVLDQKQYSISGSTITFLRVVAVDKSSDYLLFGSKMISSTNYLSLVIRVTSSGDVVWAKTYGQAATIEPLDITLRPSATGIAAAYVFIAKSLRKDADEDLEAIAIDGTGAVVASKIFPVNSKRAQKAGIITTSNGVNVVIYGGSNAVSSNGSFFIECDPSFTLSVSKMITTANPNEIRSVITGSTTREYIVAGDTGASASNKNAFIFSFDTSTTTTATTKSYTLTTGTDYSQLRLLKISTSYYLFGNKAGGSLAAKFDSTFSITWTKQLNLSPDSYFLADVKYMTATSEVQLCGWLKKSTSQLLPLAVRTDANFTTCITTTGTNPSATTVTFTIAAWSPTLANYSPTVSNATIVVASNAIPNTFKCPAPSNVINTSTGLFQSPYLYMQAAGSDQSDNSSRGIHLRWRFNRSLGEHHYAKGPYANTASPYYTTIGFNKPDDYVKLFRVPYTTKYQAKVKFQNTILPSVEINSGSTREWRYNGITLTNSGTGTTNVIIRFNDVAQYNTIRATMSPLRPLDFMKLYTGIVEIETENKLFFAAEFVVLYNSGNQANAYLRTETVSYDDSLDTTSKFLGSRKKFLGTTQLTAPRVVCENVKYMRVDYSIAYLSEIAIETYPDYITTIKGLAAASSWEFLGDNSLTLDTANSYDRLENANNPYVAPAKKYTVNKQWNKYNDSNATTGEFKVRVDNYKHRWFPAPSVEHPDTNAADGIQQTIAKYLDLSKTDTKANAAIPVEDDPGNTSSINISYFDILRLIASDYHIARMMGMGYIDANIANDTISYVYLMAYTSRGALETGDSSSLVKDHLYMSLPTTRATYRLPKPPVQKPVTYGMSIDNGFGEVNQITDADGYVAFDDVRYVNVHRDPYQYEKAFGNFFYETTEFNLSEETIPVMYGLEYKLSSESGYRKPEIMMDEEYLDLAGVNEVIEIPEQGQNPVYVHQEREMGIHNYALYAINWFSRVSTLSNQTATDYTKFRKVKNLLPPSNFAVQLIQKEEPIVFTTAKEQTALAALSTTDKTLLRATFEWNHNHNHNYPFAERAQFFYRESAPAAVRGEVLSVTQLADHKVEVTVKEYVMLSSTPVQTVAPTIPAGQENKYVGSLFSTGSDAYVVTAVTVASPYPKFTLEQIRQTSSSDPLNTNQFTTLVTWLKPSVGNKFLVVENLALGSNWSTKLNRTVYIEKFHTISSIKIENTGTANNGTYKLERVVAAGSNTTLVLLDKLKNNITAGNIRYEKTFRLAALNAGTNQLSIAGNITSELSGVTSIRVFGSSYSNDKIYTISGTPTYTAPNTVITVIGPIADAVSNFGYAAIEKTATVVSFDMASKTVTVSGSLTSVITAPYVETKINYDGTESKFTYGGISQPATVTVLPDSASGLPIGAYTVKLNGYTLQPHIDPGVEWIKGTLRISDTNPNLVSGVPQAIIKSLQVWEIKKDVSGVPLSPLELIVFDPGFATDPYPIKTGTNINVNYHPSYRLYLKAEFNSSGNNDSTHQFNQVTMLPGIGDGSKVTYMGVRSLDRVKDPQTGVVVEYDSYVGPLVPVLAQEIIAPVAPKDLTGALFATRPDFYKKSSYTVDIKLDTTGGRKPYGALVYRGSESQVLNTLYSGETLQTILPVIEQLKAGDDQAAFFTMLNELVNVVVDGSGDFILTPNSLNFSFPLPDNDDYVIPNRDSSVVVRPFLTTVPILGAQVGIVRQAILDSFLSLTEQPVIYKYVKGGITTSGKKPIYRNYNGDLVAPILPEAVGYDPNVYDPHPMAVKFAKNTSGTILVPSDTGYGTASNDFYIRFTDYTLDGASLEYYFYYACEITNQLVIGPASKVIAPVLMINADPAEAPGIREVVSILEDAENEIPTSVKFELNRYNDTEGITQFWIYRAYNAADASNIRSMTLALKIDVEDPVIDDFSDLNFPPYGETLFYRVVAVRRIKNELSEDEDILSLPSNIALTNIVDQVVPDPPKLMSENGLTTSTELQNVILKWKPTAYNATFRLQKQNTSGNWEEIYRVKVKDTEMQYPPLVDNVPDFVNYPETVVLDRLDSNGNPVFHRYRVQVENSSGLVNLTEFELTLDKGCPDLTELDGFVSFEDGNAYMIPVLQSQAVNDGFSQPDSMLFQSILSGLPAGHNTMTSLDIEVSDDLGNSDVKTISALNGSVTFNDGDGGLVLDSSDPNRTYTIKTTLKTDRCTDGTAKTFELSYISGPYNDLDSLVEILQMEDGTHTEILQNGVIDDGVAFPGSLTFEDITDLISIGQTFDRIEITVTDEVGNSSLKTISTQGGSVTFNDGDGDLLLGSAGSNFRYTIVADIYTAECTDGVKKMYKVEYTYSPCAELAGIDSPISLTDDQDTFNPLNPDGTSIGSGYPGSLTVTDISSSLLPSGHNFELMEVTVEDEMGNLFTKEILSSGGNVVFEHGDGGLLLDSSNPELSYSISVVLHTDQCSAGSWFTYILSYQ
jgi:hypothetical protein